MVDLHSLEASGDHAWAGARALALGEVAGSSAAAVRATPAPATGWACEDAAAGVTADSRVGIFLARESIVTGGKTSFLITGSGRPGRVTVPEIGTWCLKRTSPPREQHRR